MGDPADTVPPPQGEEDVYQAATRVGPVPADLLEIVRASAANLAAEEAEARALEPAKPAATERTPSMPEAEALASGVRPSQRSQPADEVPDVSYENESTEPTLDKPIRYIDRAKAAAAAKEAAAPKPKDKRRSRRSRPRGPSPIAILKLSILAAVVAFCVAALTIWLLK
ncbi:MAG: hypothetical protein HOW73_08915 [Polyangiaceae bacterium]|nr:hypothetical protein [Polyangiaceae bacterium]